LRILKFSVKGVPAWGGVGDSGKEHTEKKKLPAETGTAEREEKKKTGGRGKI